MMIKVIALMPLILVYWATAAATEIHEFPTDLNTYRFKQEKIIQRKIDGSHLTILGFIVDKNTLLEVQGILGSAEALPRQEHAPNRICYTSADGKDGTVVVFEAGALGAWKYLTAVTILSGETKFSERERCTSSDKVTKDIGTNGGLKLGLSKKELKTKLGDPTAEKNRSVLYFYQAKERFTDDELEKWVKVRPDMKNLPHPYYDITAHVEAKFTSARVTQLRVGKVESY